MEIINKYFKQLSSSQYNQLGRLGELYHYWNKRINVISRKDADTLYERHILHSLSIAKITTFEKGIRIVDIGTGGGFPGIPLAILFPEAHFILMDSIGKKIKVVDEIATSIHLNNVEAVHARAEEWKGDKFDLAITRAVAPLGTLGSWAKKILKVQNQGLICLKGGDLKEEFKESGLKTKSWEIHQFFPENFFETKMITWSEIPV
jgi:16S rRNA (guanine527-N7)-methyltransferase